MAWFYPDEAALQGKASCRIRGEIEQSDETHVFELACDTVLLIIVILL